MQLIKKHKKLCIFAGVVILVVILANILISNVRTRAQEMMKMLNQVETANVERRTLMSSVSATGTISSVQSKDVSAKLNGVELTTLSVEVGDYVQAGDVLCEFDTTDINANLEEAKDSLSNSIAKTNIDLENAERSLTEAMETSEIQTARNTQAVENAWNDYKEQKDKVASLNNELSSLKSSLEQKQMELNELSAEGSISGSDLAVNTNTIEALQQEIQSLQSSVAGKEGELAQARATEESLLNAYIKSAETKEDSARNNDSTIHSREAGLETSRLNASASGTTDKQQIKNYEEQLEACTVTAPISGVVTAVNVEVGDTYNGTAIMTIEDDSAFVVEAQIDEYDIGKIEKGQEVVIKTNATGDEELAGTVIHVAPRATQGTGSVTYTVKISVDTPNEMLRMDMTAKLSIILEKNADVLTVPYDAVCEDEEGNFYVEVADSKQEQPEGQNSYTRIYVNKGIESDYYVEVSGEGIEEGMQVVVPKSEENGLDIQLRMMQQGPMGGF